jgi:hypothetical protein
MPATHSYLKHYNTDSTDTMINIQAWLPKISATNYTHQQLNNRNESMGRNFLEKITLTQKVEEFPIFCGT